MAKVYETDTYGVNSSHSHALQMKYGALSVEAPPKTIVNW